jgi:glycosyltransferase involved in cell wall biosynthesis
MKVNKKVLTIITRLNVGGATKHVTWLSAGLNHIGWSGLLVCGLVEDDEDDMAKFATDHSLEVQYLKSLKRSIDFRNDFIAIRDIYKLLCRYKPSIVDTHMSKAGLVGRIAVMSYNLVHGDKIKTVHTFHGHTFHGYFSPIKEKIFLWIERFLARFGTDVIITISPQQQTEILDTYKVGCRSQHRQINLGIDISFANSLNKFTLRKELHITNDSKVFGIVGRIAEIKNHRLFIDSAREFRVRNPDSNVHFVIIGDGEKSYVDGLKQYASDIPSLIFAGNITNPSDFYGALDYLVLTSNNEGTPVSILEAFACGIPVVSTCVGGVIDLIGKNERGLLVAADSIQIADAYAQMLQTDHTVTTTRARQFVEEHYSVSGLVNKIDNLYHELVGEKL